MKPSEVMTKAALQILKEAVSIETVFSHDPDLSTALKLIELHVAEAQRLAKLVNAYKTQEINARLDEVRNGTIAIPEGEDVVSVTAKLVAMSASLKKETRFGMPVYLTHSSLV